MLLQIGGACSPQNDATGFGRCQRRLGSFADLVALPFAHDSVHLDHDLIGVGHVSSDEVHPGFDQAADEMNIASQTIKFSY